MTENTDLPLSTRLLPIVGLSPLLLTAAILALDPTFESNPTIHWLAQLVTGILGLFCGVLILRRSAEEGSYTLTVVGLAILGAAVLDFCYGLVVTPNYRPDTLETLIPWGWLPARVFMSSMLCLSLFVGYREQRHGPTGRRLQLFISAAAGTLVAFGCLFLMVLPWPLPAAYFPDNLVSRPAELLPAVLFMAALFGFLLRGQWRHDIFDYHLLLALIVSVLIHTLFMPFAESNFDSFFAAAVVSKIVSYAFLMVGLTLQAREAMREETSNEKVRQQAIVETASDGILTFDSDGKIDTFNPAAERLFGYTAREAVGCNISMLTTDDIEARRDQYLRQVRGARPGAGNTYEHESLGRRKDGTIFPMESAISEVMISDTHLYTAIVRDISERKQKQVELEGLTERLELALESAGLGSWNQDLRSNSLQWNVQMYKLYGLDPTEGIPTPKSWLDMTHPEDRDACIKAHIGAVENGSPIDEAFRVVRPDGSVRWMKVDGKMIRDENDDPVRLVGIIRDISESKVYLEQVERARNEADESNRAKSSFLATMSHEIRTPLNGVIGLTEVLQQTSLQSHQSEMVELISQSAAALMSVIEDILDFSKIEAGKLDIDPTPLQLTTEVENVCALLTNLADKSEISLSVFVDPAIPHNVKGDGQRLRQILTNLVNNAIKFSAGEQRRGWVTLRAEYAGEREGQALVDFRVIDNGIGMDESAQAALFSPFMQADVSTSRRFGGTGLGLTISQRLAQLMGGEITVRSEPGEGSVFTASLPFLLQETVAEEVDALPDLSGLSCLVIGDVESSATDIACYLTHAGAIVEPAISLADAQAANLSHRADRQVWVIDVDSQQPDARELIQAFESHPMAVVVSRSKLLQTQLQAADVPIVDGAVLRRRVLLEAVATWAALGVEAGDEQGLDAQGAGVFSVPSREEAIRNSRLILVAEDNEVNQQVIRHQLSVLGFRVDVARDGFEALNQWSSGEYALLLTDLQMPEMDGFELAEKIRAQETGHDRKPIVALSATILTEDVERSVAVGIDAYLCKPASLEELRKALNDCLTGVEVDAIVAT